MTAKPSVVGEAVQALFEGFPGIRQATQMTSGLPATVDTFINAMSNKTVRKSFAKFGEENVDFLVKKKAEAMEWVAQNGSLEGLPSGSVFSLPNGTGVRLKTQGASGAWDVSTGKGFSFRPTKKLNQYTTARNAKAEWLPEHTNEVYAISRELGYPDEVAEDFILAQKQGFKAMKDNVARLNAKVGDILYSIGHKIAVKHHKKGGFADRLSNIDVEQLVSQFDQLGKRTTRGNASRGANDDLPRIIERALGTGFTLREEFLKFANTDIGGFWNARYGDFLSPKDRENFAKAVKAHYVLTEKIDPDFTYAQAVDDVLRAYGFGDGKVGSTVKYGENIPLAIDEPVAITPTQVKHEIDMSDFVARMYREDAAKAAEERALRESLRSDSGRKLVNVTPEPEGRSFDLNNLLGNDRL